MEKLRELKAKISGLDEDLESNPNRRLVREGEIKKVSHGKAQMRYFFLFTDMIMYCRARRGKKKLEHKGHFSLGETILAPVTDQRLYKHAFELVRLDGKKRRYILAFPSDKDMNSWKSDIDDLIRQHVARQKLASDEKALKQQEVECMETERRIQSARIKARKQGCDNIFDAAYQGNVEMLDFYLKSGAPVNGFDEEGLTPLMNAALQGHLECVALLHSYGGDVQMVDDQKQTCLHKAAYHPGKSAVAAFLIEKGCPVNARESFGCSALHYAATYSDIDTVKILINHGADINQTDNTGGTPLHYSCRVGNKEVVALLLQKGANFKARDSDRLTPIYQASFFGHAEIVSVLLHHYASEQKTKKTPSKEPTGCDNIQGVVPLHCAALMGHLPVVEVLFEYEPLANVKDKQGSTPLHKACKKDQAHVAEFLLNKGADIDATTLSGETPLHMACANGSIRCVELLLSKGCDLEAVDRAGRGALHRAVESGNYDIVLWIMDECRDVNPRDALGTTPVHIAIQKDFMDIAKLLLEHGASYEGCLHVAAQYERKAFIGLLSSMGASINELNDDGETPLQVAFKMGNSSAVKALIRRGAVLSENEEDAERKLKEMFLLSVFEKINIPLNDVNGARVWDILENFAKQVSVTLGLEDDEREDHQEEWETDEPSQRERSKKLDRIEQELLELFPDWDKEDREQLQEYFYYFQHAGSPASSQQQEAVPMQTNAPEDAGANRASAKVAAPAEPPSPTKLNPSAAPSTSETQSEEIPQLPPIPQTLTSGSPGATVAPPGPPVPAPPGAPPGVPPPGAPMAPGAQTGASNNRKMLKKLLWRKIPTAKLEGGFWDEVRQSGSVKIDEEEIEKLFRREAPRKAQGKERVMREDTDLVRVLDPQRARNITIVANRLRIPFIEIRQAIWNLDSTVLTIDRVQILLKTIPSDQEMDLLTQYAADPSRLGISEQFCLELMNVPRLRQRLECIQFRLDFPETIAELKTDINYVAQACHEVLHNKNFKGFLGCVLMVGNFLNAGSFVGDAEAFTIDSLLKITDVTSTKGGDHSLLDYVISLLLRTKPEYLNFSNELRNVKMAAQDRISMIPTTLQNISTGLGMIGEELDLAWEQDPFMRVFPAFLAEAKKEVSCLKEPVLTYQNNYLTLLRIFGEDPKTPIVDFFKVLHRFLTAFQKCHAEILQKREKQQLARIKGNMNNMMDELKDKLLAPQLLGPKPVPRVRAPTTCLLLE